MQYKWLIKNNNKNLILFFNGWGMNETPFVHLKGAEFDILMVFDYRNFDFNFNQFDFSKYEKKYLICWSMGVYVSNLFYSELNNFDKKIAINGTSKIIDNNFGIPEKIYNITAKFLNEDSKNKFILNMFNQEKLNPKVTITRTLDELKEELISLKNIKLKETLKFDKIIISKDDKIIPAKNQINFWQTQNYVLINAAHCPFENYSSWIDLLC